MFKYKRWLELYKNWLRKSKQLCNSNGLTLLEVLAVLVILSILVLIAVPSIFSRIEQAKAEVCQTNRIELVRSYERNLTLEDKVHNELLFAMHVREFGERICPENGVITYVDGEVNCSVHTVNDHEEDEEAEEVPFL